MAVPYTFGSATSSIPLSQLDSNFATGITLGNTTVYLGNTTTSFGNVTLTNVTISSVAAAITPSQGGTGLVTIPANNVMLGNGTANVTVVAPGTSGNVLTSNGTTWASTALSAASVPAAGSTTQVQYNNAGAFAGSANLTFNGTTLTAAGLSGPFNGTVGATTANTGAFTTLSASSTVSGTGFSTYLASPPAIGGTAAAAGTFTTLTTSSTITDNGGTANGVTYLNGSKVVTSGSALTFDGTNLGVGTTAPANKLTVSVVGNATLNTPAAYASIFNSNDAVNSQYYGLAFTNSNTPEGGTQKPQALISCIATGGSWSSNWAGALVFSTASGGSNAAPTEKARITSDGNLLVGTTTSSARITATSADATASTYLFYGLNSASTQLFFVRSDGLFATGTAANSPYNYTTGSAANTFVNSSGQLMRSTSSLKYKTDVQNATHGLSKVMALRPVTYKGKNDGDLIFGGLIAEEVHEAGLSEFVQYAQDGSPDALAYGNMVSLAFKAIQEQQAIIESLKARLDAANL